MNAINWDYRFFTNYRAVNVNRKVSNMLKFGVGADIRLRLHHNDAAPAL
jgi:hypothetical protein